MVPALLCETVTGASMAELLAARAAASIGDIVELRLDGVADLDVAAALARRRGPVIVTCRPRWEGGRFSGNEQERRAVLAGALALGVEFVDVEWQALRQGGAGFDELIRAHRARVVVSSHDFGGVPPDLPERVRAMRSTGAAVVKVAVTSTRLADTLPLIEIARGGNAVVVGMGDAGVPTRRLASRFRSRWTYAGDGAAPGQVPARRIVEQFRFRDIGAKTAIYGVVGDNVMHSVSPAMHNAAFRAAGIDAVYVPLRAADIGDFLTFADALEIAGASVTIPFKIDALTASSSCDDLTRSVGAANTLRRRNREWEATNTDVAGFLEPLESIVGADRAGADVQVDLYKNLRVSVLGAGGSARAVIVALASRGAQVTVHARRRDQAEAVASDLSEIVASGGIVASGFSRKVETGPWPPEPGSWDVLVNCTPLGSASARGTSPLPGGPFDGRLVYDLTYGATESPLLREARLAGCATLAGLPILLAPAER